MKSNALKRRDAAAYTYSNEVVTSATAVCSQHIQQGTHAYTMCHEGRLRQHHAASSHTHMCTYTCMHAYYWL